MESTLNFLESDILISTILHLPIEDIQNLCSTNKILNKNLCQNNEFWKQKYIYDYGTSIIENTDKIINWKEKYFNPFPHYLIGFGDDSENQLGLGIRYPKQSIYQQLGMESDNVIRHISEPTIIDIQSPIKIWAGTSNSMVLDNQNRLWGFGNNEERQLSLGDKINRKIPAEIDITKIITEGNGIKQISLSKNTSMVLDNNGHIWISGKMRYPLRYTEFKQIEGLNNIELIQSGPGFRIAIDKNGDMWIYSISDKKFGNVTNNIITFEKFPEFKNIKDVSSTLKTITILDYQNQIFTKDFPYKGIDKVDKEEYNAINFPEYKNEKYNLAKAKDNDTTYLFEFMGNTNIIKNPIFRKTGNYKFSGGEHYILALDEYGKLYSYGSNRNGELGINNDNIKSRKFFGKVSGLKDIIDISAGSFHALIIGKFNIIPFSKYELLNKEGNFIDFKISNNSSKITTNKNKVLIFTDKKDDKYYVIAQYDEKENIIYPPL